MIIKDIRKNFNKDIIIFIMSFILLVCLIIDNNNPLFFKDTFDVNYLLNGFVFAYGLLIIFLYLISKKKEQYLLIYGLIISIIFCSLMFLAPLFNYYVESTGFVYPHFVFLILVIMVIRIVFKGIFIKDNLILNIIYIALYLVMIILSVFISELMLSILLMVISISEFVLLNFVFKKVIK